MRVEMAHLEEKANAPLKRKPDSSGVEPPKKKPRLIDVLGSEASEPEVAKPKPKPKPKAKLTQPKLSSFFKKI